MDMWKGSTPTLAFKFPFKTNTIKALTFKCKQGDSVKISKALSDFSTSGENILYILLTQADTLALISEEYVTIQFKVQFTNNHVLPSSKMILPVQDVIDTVAMDGTATAEAPTFAVDVPFPTIDGSFSVVMGMSVVGGASSVAWTDITGKPETFPPSSHTHTKSQITDLPNIPTKTSDLTNDGEGTNPFLTSHQSLSGYATQSWVNQQGFLISHQDISGKADKSELEKTNRRVNALYKISEGQIYDIETRTLSCYSLNVLTGAFRLNVLKIGGKSFVVNQILQNGNFTDTTGWNPTRCLISANGNVLSYTAQNPYSMVLKNIGTLKNGHKYILTGDVNASNTNVRIGIIHSNLFESVLAESVSSFNTLGLIYECNDSTDHTIRLSDTSVNGTSYFKNIMLIDLTEILGEGNEPTTVEEFKAVFPKDYYAYNTGNIVNVGCKKVVVKDDDGIVISTTNIPQAIQNLTGYGWSAGSAFNEVDYANKKYIQRVGSRAYQSGDENNSSYVTDKTTTHYPLATPIETSISSIISTGFLESLAVETGDTVTFVHDTDDNYRLPAQSTNEFYVTLSEVK